MGQGKFLAPLFWSIDQIVSLINQIKHFFQKSFDAPPFSLSLIEFSQESSRVKMPHPGVHDGEILFASRAENAYFWPESMSYLSALRAFARAPKLRPSSPRKFAARVAAPVLLHKKMSQNSLAEAAWPENPVAKACARCRSTEVIKRIDLRRRSVIKCSHGYK